ncbi:Ti-type conjugative transfer relaxase TraA [Lichenicoccus roseus]|uniref:Ti-type conjugative transfer relaxase TraA n=1 Tax=Lichenicoccus roseus TaxID=2683649 RepID=A0A5R9IYV6_9PROT|nr:Ti-type conjugative transfer relaxase TraA [Lichenicoccus roseus]TLU70664.1 Ti-type conjugative transfer relaxase TraA [Lichenicoccus roseus]
MAIYHFSAKVIGRSSGRSAVAAAAYRAAECLHDAALGRAHDYTAKAGVIHREILLPDGAAPRWLDRATLWNEVEAGEKRRDAQLARDIEIALPRELGRSEAIRLVRDFGREQFVGRGMVADLNVHWTRAADGELQPHAHVMLTMREVVPGRDGHEEGARFGRKVVAWNDRGLLFGWRERWASLANERLAELGHDVRIDHRSYAAQGIPLEPQHKIGPAGARRAQRGEAAERADEHEGIARRNGARIAAAPEIALDVLTQQHSTFTRRDLARLVHRHTADAAQFADVLAKVEASDELVRLGVDGRGAERFTTQAMLATEQRMEEAAATLGARQAHRVSPARRSDGAGLDGEQALALAHVMRARDLSVVVGYAGTGKSTMLGVARQAWAAEGYTVRGAALSGIAAEGLEGGAGIASRTVHSLLHAWDKGYDTLSARDVLVVDEAGMIGSRQMERLLSAAASAGAKVVLVGDPEQLQAIEAGAAFRAIAERVGSVEITEVRRQRDVWQQQATRELATGRTAQALDRYEAAGMVAGHDTLEAAKAAVVAGWDAVRQARPDASQIILAYRRDDVRDLNEQARAVRRAAGELGADQVLVTERGERTFATGDRLYFLRNERGLGVKNGTLGTLVAIEAGGERLTVRLDGPGGKAGGGTDVTFYLRDYDHIDHGYAATVHKSQGVTVDQAHVLATGLMDRHAAYVGLTRHRDAVRLHWSADEIGSRDKLAQVLGRERLKDTSLDYGLGGPGSLGATPAQMQAERDDLVRAYGGRRGVSMPISEIVVPAAAEPAQRVAAGRAGFRDRYAAHQQQRQQAAERDQQAHGLVRQWDGLVKDYTAALPGLGSDPGLAMARERLVAFGQEVRKRPDLVAVLCARDAEFGVAERPTLHGVLGHAQPERAIAAFLEVAETTTRRQQQDQVRQREVELDQARRPTRSRGPSLGM